MEMKRDPIGDHPKRLDTIVHLIAYSGPPEGKPFGRCKQSAGALMTSSIATRPQVPDHTRIHGRRSKKRLLLISSTY